MFLLKKEASQKAAKVCCVCMIHICLAIVNVFQKAKHYTGGDTGTVKEATQRSFESLVKYCEEAR